jgi:hypothetical protein
MLNVPKYSEKANPNWTKFLKSGLVEDCPICNPEILFLYRLNPENEPVVHTNFHMTYEVEPKTRRNFLKSKKNYKRCKHAPSYDHNHHKYNSVKTLSRNQSLYGSFTTDNDIQSFLDKFGRSINEKIKFKKNLSKSKLFNSKINLKKKYPRKNNEPSISYSKLFEQKSQKYFNNQN